MINTLLLSCVILVLLGLCGYLSYCLKQETQRIVTPNILGSIKVVDGEVVISDILVEGVTLDVTEAGLCKVQRVYFDGCNPAMKIYPDISPTTNYATRRQHD